MHFTPSGLEYCSFAHLNLALSCKLFKQCSSSPLIPELFHLVIHLLGPEYDLNLSCTFSSSFLIELLRFAFFSLYKYNNDLIL